MQRLVIIFFLLISIHCLYAQEPAHYIIGKEYFDGVDLYSILQANDNSMWISADDGLYHYDGIAFEHLLPEGKGGISLFNLIKDRNGSVYCNSINGEIYRVENNQLKLFFKIPKKYNSDLFYFHFDKENNLNIKGDSPSGSYILTVNQKRKIIHIKKFKHVISVKSHSDTLFYLQSTPASYVYDLYAFTSYKNIKKIQSGKLKYERGIKKIERINGKFYSYNYVFKKFNIFNPNQKKLDFAFLNNRELRLFTTEQHLWFSDFKNGVYCVEKDSLSKPNTPKKWFGKSFISGALQDNEGNVWLLTFNKGIIIIPNLAITTTLPPSGEIEFKYIHRYNNQIFASGNTGRIYRLANQQFTPYFNGNSNRVEYFYLSENLITTNLFVYSDNKSKKIAQYGYIRKTIQSGDSLILGTSSGMASFDIKNKKKNEKLFTKTRVYDLVQDTTISDSIFYITSDGLHTYWKGKATPFLHQDKQLKIKKIISIGKQYWCTSRNGLYIIDNHQVIQHQTTENSNLISNIIYQIKYEAPFVYLSTDKGMQQYNLSDSTSRTFTQADGLNKELKRFDVLNETVYGINSDGLIHFSFNNTSNEIPKYQNIIKNVQVINGNKTIKNNASLAPDEHNIEFSFLCSTFKYQKNIRYEYQLVGIDKSSKKARDNQHYVTYTNLPAGNYTFEVNSYIGDSKNETAYFSFKIAEYWYNTIWFKALLIISFILVLYYIYRVRLNIIIQKRDKERMQKQLAESSLTSLKSQMNPHFLFNAMNSIQSLILNDNKDEAYEYLTQLSNLVRENLKMSDVTFVSFDKELRLIEKYLELEKLRFEDTLIYEIINELPNNSVLIPSMIVQPFIENAIKHGLLHKKSNRRLWISFYYFPTEGLIKCIVEDNGIGRKASGIIQKKRSHNSFSTNAINKRFAILREYYQLDIKFEYEDLYTQNRASGTKVTINIPFKDE